MFQIGSTWLAPVGGSKETPNNVIAVKAPSRGRRRRRKKDSIFVPGHDLLRIVADIKGYITSIIVISF